MWKQRPPFQYEPLKLPANGSLTPEQLAVLAELRSLEQRIIQRRLWSAPAVRELLAGAAQTTLAGDPEKGRQLLDRASEIFWDDVQTKNRLFYLLGAVLGLTTMFLVTVLILRLAKMFNISSLAEPDTVISLFAFAGLGSLASVLSRLTTIDLREEMRLKWVVVSAGTRPLLAIAFASVAYIILAHDLVSLNGFTEEPAKSALIWVAAFLCGFSERFGVELLERVSFVGSSAENAPPDR